jgi:hypothetical protein
VAVDRLRDLLERPNPVAIDRWLTIGALDPGEWTALGGARWRQRAGRISVTGAGTGFGGRSLCLAVDEPLVAVGRHRLQGVIQASAQDDISYAKACRLFAHGLHITESQVKPASWRGSDQSPEHVPEHTTLDHWLVSAAGRR